MCHQPWAVVKSIQGQVITVVTLVTGLVPPHLHYSQTNKLTHALTMLIYWLYQVHILCNALRLMDIGGYNYSHTRTMWGKALVSTCTPCGPNASISTIDSFFDCGAKIMFNFYPGLPHVLFDNVHMHTQPHTQRFPEPDTKSAGTETSQVLNMKVCGLSLCQQLEIAYKSGAAGMAPFIRTAILFLTSNGICRCT